MTRRAEVVVVQSWYPREAFANRVELVARVVCGADGGETGRSMRSVAAGAAGGCFCGCGLTHPLSPH